ncbi:19204_t:CDS:2 [Gigaspora rosea]|nr:19204_t:CDS:2 [Gigaspora rosea]
MGNKQSIRKKVHSFEENDTEFMSDQMNLGQNIMREVWQGNFSSPIDDALKKGARVLDVGSGTGTWICEMAADYQKSEYIGIDILKLHPNIKPFNVQFIQHNILKGLPFEDNSFDYVHAQMLIFDITSSDWENIVYKECCRVLKPGGWLEITDLDTTCYNPGPLMSQFNTSGINLLIIKQHRELMSSMPTLTLVQQEERVYPLGSWAGKIGILAGSYIKDSCKNFLSWAHPKKNSEKTLNELSAEFEMYKSYCITFRLYAKKT